MGQYHLTVNLDKREFLDPHKLGDGLKLWEQANSRGGTMVALWILLACSNGGGGGDFEEHPLVGRWAGDRVAIVGDYAEDSDLVPEHRAGSVYDRCRGCDPETGEERPELADFRDVSDDILPLVERACGVKITGDGWRQKEAAGGMRTRAMRPDFVIGVSQHEEPGEEG